MSVRFGRSYAETISAHTEQTASCSRWLLVGGAVIMTRKGSSIYPQNWMSWQSRSTADTCSWVNVSGRSISMPRKNCTDSKTSLKVWHLPRTTKSIMVCSWKSRPHTMMWSEFGIQKMWWYKILVPLSLLTWHKGKMKNQRISDNSFLFSWILRKNIWPFSYFFVLLSPTNKSGM